MIRIAGAALPFDFQANIWQILKNSSQKAYIKGDEEVPMKERETQRNQPIPKVSPPTATFVKSVPYLIRSRVEPLFIWTFNTFIACMVAGKGSPPLAVTASILIGVIFITIAVYVYNDIIDAQMDALNSMKKNRPLPLKKVSEKNAYHAVYLVASTGFVIIFFVNTYSFLYALLFFWLFFAYSHPRISLKKRFLFKEAVITCGLPLTSLIGMYAVAGSFVMSAFFVSILFATFAYASQPYLTDSVDIEEDRLAGAKTLAMVLTWKKKVALLTAGAVITMVLTLVTFDRFNFTVIVPLVTVGGGVVFLGFIIPLMRNFTETAIMKVRRITMVYFILFEISFVLGSINM
jgi:4-hydroxybenzoate polyprenyltransferase